METNNMEQDYFESLIFNEDVSQENLDLYTEAIEDDIVATNTKEVYEYNFAIDRKTVVWERSHFTIKAISQEEAASKILAINKDMSDNSESDDVIFVDAEILYDTIEYQFNDNNQLIQEIIDLDTNETIYDSK